ncbi:MAG TPA: hypothetical protein VGM51_12035 [Armatimonadota bacterium]|jgi:hypothetical protein
MKILRELKWWIVGVVLFVFLYVWPGIWRYQCLSGGMVRIDRLTHQKMVDDYDGHWVVGAKD